MVEAQLVSSPMRNTARKKVFILMQNYASYEEFAMGTRGCGGELSDFGICVGIDGKGNGVALDEAGVIENVSKVSG